MLSQVYHCCTGDPMSNCRFNIIIFVHLYSEKHFLETVLSTGKMSKFELLKVKFMMHIDLCVYTWEIFHLDLEIPIRI